MLGQSSFSLFTSRITGERFEFERTRAPAYGFPVFKLGEYAAELPRKFISLHCFENESKELKDSNTEGTEKLSPTKSLAVSQVTGAEESAIRESRDTNEERVVVGSQESLL